MDVLGGAKWTPPGREIRPLVLEEFFDFGYVFRDVYAYGVMFYFGDADFPAIFQPTQLLELLDFLEAALGESGVFEMGVALEYIEA